VRNHFHRRTINNNRYIHRSIIILYLDKYREEAEIHRRISECYFVYFKYHMLTTNAAHAAMHTPNEATLHRAYKLLYRNHNVPSWTIPATPPAIGHTAMPPLVPAGDKALPARTCITLACQVYL
jgi:hypothetical protein